MMAQIQMVTEIPVLAWTTKVPIITMQVHTYNPATEATVMGMGNNSMVTHTRTTGIAGLARKPRTFWAFLVMAEAERWLGDLVCGR